MAQAPRKLQTYEIETPSGEVYEVQAYDDAQAQRIGDFIQQQVAAGNPQLEGVQLPDEAVVEQRPPEQPDIAGAEYVNTGGLEGLVSGEGERQLDRSGVLNTVDAAGRAIARGATFNFADELASGANAILPLDALTGRPVESMYTQDIGDVSGVDPTVQNALRFWQAFKRNLNLENQIDAADDSQHPVATGVGKFTGAVGGTLLGGRALLGGASATLPARLTVPAALRYEAAVLANPIRTGTATAAAGGGATGLLSGAGEGDTLESRARSAAGGLLLGTPLGAAGGAVITGFGPAVQRYAQALLGRGNDREALRQLQQALTRDGYDVTSPAGVQALRDELASYGAKPVSLSDVGTATRSRTGVGLRSENDAQQRTIDAIRARQEGQGPRLQQDVLANVAPRSDVYALDDALVQQRADVALPLREAALTERQVIPPEIPLAAPFAEAPEAGLNRILAGAPSMNSTLRGIDDDFINALAAKSGIEPPAPAPQVAGPPAPQIIERASRMVNDPTIQAMTELPLMQQALAGAIKQSQNERALRQVLGQPLDDVPEILAGQPLDMRTADYLKRYLDDQVNKLYSRADTESFTAAQARQVRDLRDAFRERLRATNEEYGQYLDAYSGSSEMIDALAAGRDFRKLDPEQILADQGGRSQAAQELYRVGAARDLIDVLRSTGDNSNPANRILQSPEARDQLAATGANVGPLARAVQQERTLNLLPAELAGSASDQRLAARQAADAGAQLNIPFNPSSPISWIGSALRGVSERARLQRNAGVNEAYLPRATATDPAQIDATINELIQQGDIDNALILMRQQRAARFGAGAGAVIGGPVALREGN